MIIGSLKIIRTKTEIGRTPVSIAFAAIKLAQQIHGDLSKSTALMIGAGETSTLVARHLKRVNIGEVYVANRTKANSELITQICGGKTIDLTDIPRFLQKADMVISSINTKKPVIGFDIAKLSISKKKKPIFFVDLGVPRNIHQDVGSLEAAFLYTIDDLKVIVESNMGTRSVAAIEAEEIVNFKTTDFLEWEKIQTVSDYIHLYRDQTEALCNQEINNSLRQLEKGTDPQEIIKQMGQRITSKLIHTPTTKLREYAGEKEVIKKAIEILGVDLKNH